VAEDAGDIAEALAVDRAFGAENRQRIIGQYLSRLSEPVTTADAWKHVYRLLLWINPTISLAHCYESDKCQPGKAWYPRSLAFHVWVSNELGVTPEDLHGHIDFMFHEAVPSLARIESAVRRRAAEEALKTYPEASIPLPGDDPDLIGIVIDVLGPDLTDGTLDFDRAHRLVELVHAHFGLENKRKNLLGRGFEDVLAAIIRRLPGADGWEVRTRAALKDIPGFASHGSALERAEIDLALWQKQARGRRILVSAKWSVRADRERQFTSDFSEYEKANSAGPFDYLLITNEFDAARLYAAANMIYGSGYLFRQVVHVQPEGVLVAYGDEAKPAPKPPKQSGGRKARNLPSLMQEGRLGDLGSWLDSVLTP
jgi:hypothetical protein